MFWRDWPLISELVVMPSTVKPFSAPLAPFTWKPPSTSPAFTDGAVRAIDWKDRPFGSRSNSSALTLWAISVLRLSTSGEASAVTCTDSVRAPTVSWVLTSNERPSATLTSGRSTRVNPASSNSTLYRPGFRSAATNWPLASVTNERVSPEERLVTVTVTPGMAASCWSVTRPCRVPKRSCAAAWLVIASASARTSALRRAYMNGSL